MAINAGASSAGAGAAAAAGFGPLHQGSDGAGSIRMPAHFCGVFGLKPSFGRVPYYPVGTGDCTSHIGPMTRTVADGALMLEVMAGPHPLDYTSLEAGPRLISARLHEGIKGKRIAYSPDLGHARVDPEVAALVAGRRRRGSANSAPWWSKCRRHGPARPGAGPLLLVGAHDAPASRCWSNWETQMDPGLVACIQDGGEYSVAEYQTARERKMRLCRRHAPLVRGLGLPADALGFGRRIPGREADAGALAAASTGTG